MRIIAVISAILLCAGCGVPQSTIEDEAFGMARLFVKQELAAPTTAKFPPAEQATIRQLPDGYWQVSGVVDAQNVFGAQIRNRYYCELAPLPDDPSKWHCRTVRVGP